MYICIRETEAEEITNVKKTKKYLIVILGTVS